jgi:hypothetical protein
VPKEIATPARTHMTGTNQRLDPTLTASFRNHISRALPNWPRRMRRVSQHPDEHRPERPILLAVDQQPSARRRLAVWRGLPAGSEIPPGFSKSGRRSISRRCSRHQGR